MVYVVLFLIYVISGCFYAICHKKLRETIFNIGNPKYGKTKNFEKLSKKIDIYTTFVHHYVVCISLSYTVIFLFCDINCKTKKNIGNKYSSGYICGVTIPAWFQWNLDIYPWKYFLLLCNIFNLIYILPKGASLVILYYGFIVFTVDRIEHLISSLKYVHPQKDQQESRKELIRCIDYYRDITK